MGHEDWGWEATPTHLCMHTSDGAGSLSAAHCHQVKPNCGWMCVVGCQALSAYASQGSSTVHCLLDHTFRNALRQATLANVTRPSTWLHVRCANCPRISLNLQGSFEDTGASTSGAAVHADAAAAVLTCR